ALAMGAVPVVVDFGGPGDIVYPEIGYKVPLTNESDVAAQIERILADISRDPSTLEPLRQRGMRFARENLSWDAKAEAVTQILCWVARRGPKPDLRPPQVSSRENATIEGASRRQQDRGLRRTGEL